MTGFLDKINFVSRELAHNKAVKEQLELLKDDFANASTTDEILHKLNSYPEDVRIDYKNKIKYLLYFFALLTLSVTWFLFQRNAELFSYIVVISIAFSFHMAASWYSKKNEERQNILQSFVSKFEELRYGFKYFGDQEKYTFDELKTEYSKIFECGNHNNNLPIHATGKRSINGHELDYSLFKYKFCYVSTGTKRVKNKQVRYKIYNNFSQWGVFISNVNSPSFSVATYNNKVYPVSWTTSHTAFNKKYNITAESEIEIAKIMQPANVLILESFMESVPAKSQLISSSESPNSHDVYNFYEGSNNYEVIASANQGTLCWKMNMDVFESATSGHDGLKTPKELASFLDSINLVNFEKVFDLITPLIKKVKK